jgi:hypothetical protein
MTLKHLRDQFCTGQCRPFWHLFYCNYSLFIWTISKQVVSQVHEGVFVDRGSRVAGRFNKTASAAITSKRMFKLQCHFSLTYTDLV